MSEFDEGPEWGWCTLESCHEAAFPIWLSGGFPDDPDLLLCPKHIGAYIARLQAAEDEDPEEANAADRAALKRLQERIAQDLRAAEERGRVRTRIEWRGYLRTCIERDRSLRDRLSRLEDACRAVFQYLIRTHGSEDAQAALRAALEDKPGNDHL